MVQNTIYFNKWRFILSSAFLLLHPGLYAVLTENGGSISSSSTAPGEIPPLLGNGGPLGMASLPLPFSLGPTAPLTLTPPRNSAPPLKKHRSDVSPFSLLKSSASRSKKEEILPSSSSFGKPHFMQAKREASKGTIVRVLFTSSAPRISAHPTCVAPLTQPAHPKEALLYAAQKGDLKTVCLLLPLRLPFDPLRDYTEGFFWHLVKIFQSLQNVLNTSPSPEEASLKYEENIEAISSFSPHCVDINGEAGGLSALMLAAEHDHISIVQQLLDNGADPQRTNRSGETAFMIAARKQHKAIVELLWTYGRKQGSITIKTAQRLPPYDTILMYIIRLGDKEKAQVLLQEGALVNQSNKEGKTPLLLAMEQKDGPMAVLLLQYGAYPQSVDEKNTALELAYKQGHEEIIQALENAIASEQSLPSTLLPPLAREASSSSSSSPLTFMAVDAQEDT